MEKKFLYGKNDASGTTIIENEGSPNYQLGVSPPHGSLLKSNHHLFFAGDFHQIPDTIRCEIWSYSNAGEKIRKIGDALIY